MNCRVLRFLLLWHFTVYWGFCFILNLCSISTHLIKGLCDFSGGTVNWTLMSLQSLTRCIQYYSVYCHNAPWWMSAAHILNAGSVYVCSLQSTFNLYLWLEIVSCFKDITCRYDVRPFPMRSISSQVTLGSELFAHSFIPWIAIMLLSGISYN